MKKWICYLSVEVHGDDHREAEDRVKAELDGSGIKIRGGMSTVKYDSYLDDTYLLKKD